MNEIQIFNNSEFGSVRTVEADGKILFCGKDIASALGYSNTNDALSMHCKSDGVVNRYPITDSLGRSQKARFIPEGDVYRLIVHSKLESAQKFETWVFDEVLPSIRKHGLYAIDELASNPDLLFEVVTNYKAEREARLAAEKQSNLLKSEVKQLNHAIEYDKVCDWKVWNIFKKQLGYKGNFKNLVEKIPLIEGEDFERKVMGYDNYKTILISPNGEEKLIDYKENVLDEI